MNMEFAMCAGPIFNLGITALSAGQRWMGVVKVDKPENPFKPRSMIWALMEEDWSDLTVRQVAEVFDTTAETVYKSVRRIKQVTGYKVVFKVAKRGPKIVR